jgi:hypothetical protein
MCKIRQREVLHNEIERLCDCAHVRSANRNSIGCSRTSGSAFAQQ